jgi:hypothetical protein
MKNSKSGHKSKKSSKAKDSVKSKKVIVSIYGPSEEDIREKANEIYLQRVELGEYGTAESDWSEAEKYLIDSKVNQPE